MAFSYSVVDKDVPGNRKLTVTNVTLDNSSYVAGGFTPAASDLGFDHAISHILSAQVLGSGFVGAVDGPNQKILIYKSNSAVFRTRDIVLSGGLSVAAGVLRYAFPSAVAVVDVAATANTAPVGSSILFDVNKNGTTIFTTQANRPAILAAANATAANAVPDVTAFAAGDYLTLDVDQVGSGTAGSNAVVTVRYQHAAEALAADLSTAVKVRITALGR
jgi:hypothetical protein